MKLFVFVFAFALTAQELPKGETLFDKYVEVTGGKAAYAQRRSEVAKGEVKMSAAGVSGTVEMYSQAPNSQVIIMDVQGVGRIEQGTNGNIAWESSAVMGPRLKTGEEKTEALQEALFNLPVNWRKIYSKATTMALEPAEGKECYRVVVTPLAGGKPETFWFDRKTGLNVKIKRTAVTAMGEIPAEIVMENYQKTGPILQPTTLLQRAGGQEVTILLKTFEPNVAIPASRFVPPMEVRQLMTPASAKPAVPRPAVMQPKKKAA
jgi:outer membrane lipoprotein-sorting protein